MVVLLLASLLPGEPHAPRDTTPNTSRDSGPWTSRFPPILVNRRTMQIIDGTHRMLAAVAQGRQTIEAELVDGTGEDAFLLAVSANVDHGLPLSRKDRWIAAKRIIASHPHLSDRAIACISSRSAKAVAALRARSSEGRPQLNARRGRDGRMRPLDAAKARLRAAELITEHPDASLRHIAALVGLSPATVSDVRRRLASRLPPAGPKHHPAGPAADADEDGTVPDGTGRAEPAAATAGGGPGGAGEPRASRMASCHGKRRPAPDPDVLIEQLTGDPSLRRRKDGGTC